MGRYLNIVKALRTEPKRWLVTGAAGFIGSNLAERLLALGQHVVGLDNFATGHRANLDDVLQSVGPEAAARFRFIEGDIRDEQTCRKAVDGVDFVLHQAALGSVPRSVEDPLTSNHVNVDGTLTMLTAARDANVARFVYASSSSVYGDDESETKREDRLGRPLSPYAATKLTNEVYADVFTKTYGIECIGLRYFNVFGPRQDPNGPYAAVIPRWTERLIAGETCQLFGSGDKSRDFCYVENVVQANLLAATAGRDAVNARVFNIACGERTSLEQLYTLIRERVARQYPGAARVELERLPPRVGDIAHSLAEIDRAQELLGYEPDYPIARGLDQAVTWYIASHRARAQKADAPDAPNAAVSAAE